MKAILKTILFAVPFVLRRTAKKHPAFQKEMSRHNCTVQIKLKDESIGRHYSFRDGKVTSGAGIHPNPDVAMTFRDLQTALVFLKPPMDRAEIVHAAKQFRVVITGPDEL
ncbi:MAG TPA: pyrogallol hydroxytransferase large subunit, partial [Burkholderiaceae bacterium]|nr:pyrogallol hydroxytransferase large subunit [Burkholderiaceae bacterium]